MPTNHIGTLTETSLHAAIKSWYARPGDVFEVERDNYLIDIVRDDLLIEIQLRNFSALKPKLATLLEASPVRILHPIPRQKWIRREDSAGRRVSRRKSPKRGQVFDVFNELVYIPHLIPHPNFSLDVLLTQEEEILRDDGRGSWRRKGWSRYDRRLLAVDELVPLRGLEDYLNLLPPTLPQPFTNQELAAALGCRPRTAGRISYTLRVAGGLALVGRKGKAHLFAKSAETGPSDSAAPLPG